MRYFMPVNLAKYWKLEISGTIGMWVETIVYCWWKCSGQSHSDEYLFVCGQIKYSLYYELIMLTVVYIQSNFHRAKGIDLEKDV